MSAEGILTIRSGRAEGRPTVNRDVALAIEEAVNLQKRLETIKKQLDERKDVVRAFALKLDVDGKSVHITTADGAHAEVTFTDDVKVADADGLKALLGERFDDLVGTTTTYKPKSALVEIAVAGDPGDREIDQAQLRALLTVKAGTPTVKFDLAEKKK